MESSAKADRSNDDENKPINPKGSPEELVDLPASAVLGTAVLKIMPFRSMMKIFNFSYWSCYIGPIQTFLCSENAHFMLSHTSTTDDSVNMTIMVIRERVMTHHFVILNPIISFFSHHYGNHLRKKQNVMMAYNKTPFLVWNNRK